MSVLALVFTVFLAVFALLFLWSLYLELYGTRSGSAIWSILTLLLIYQALQYTAPPWLSPSLMELFTFAGAILIPILFATEFKRALVRLGAYLDPQRIFSHLSPLSQEVADALYEALLELASDGIGALIVIEQRADLRSYISDGVELNARVSAPLLLTIFSPESSNPLHDGAVIISDHILSHASTFLPMTRARDVKQHFGTRHRAALGITEETDALVLLVSEERKWISMAYAGQIQEDLSAEELKSVLERFCRREGYSLPS